MFNYLGVVHDTCITPRWKIFNIPSKTDVRYSVVLNQKRDFQQAVEKFRIEVPHWSKMSSCCIVDNSVNTKNINVIFLDGYQFCGCLSLRLFYQESFFTKASNSLLVFLNKLKKGGTYTWQNTFIYIKCTASQKWALFYDLFEFFIKSLGNSVIGTQFFTHLICNDLIIKELCFLQNIKENQTSKHFFPSLCEFQTIKTEKQETARIVSKRKFGIKIRLENNSKDYKISTKKRNSIDGDCVNKYKYFKSSSNVSKNCCRCKENKWQYFKPVVKYVGHNYTNILEAKGMLNKLEITQTYSEDSIIYSNVVPKSGSLGKRNINLTFACSVKTPRLSNPTKEAPLKWKPYHTEPEKMATIDRNVTKTEPNYADNELFDKENIILQNDVIQNLRNNQTLNNEHFSDNVDHKQCAFTQNSPEMFSEKTKCYQNYNSCLTFQTAGGKPLKVSKEALQMAQKMYTEVCSQVIDTNKTEPNGSLSNLQQENLKHQLVSSGASKSISNHEYFDENMDTSLDEKFFEEISFDEKEADNLLNSQSSNIPSNTSFKAHSGKGRKSLGGRRSLKPYIKKLS